MATVVLVEDQPDEREAMVLALQHAGHHVTTAVNGRDGLDLVFATMPDVVVSDVDMPLMSGAAMCERLRADRRTRLLPIVLFGGHPASVDACVNCVGATAVLTKPFTNADLRDCVEHALRAGRQPGPAAVGGERTD